jgi:transposase
VQQSDRFGGGGVMVWGAISHGWKSALVTINGNLTAQRYMDLVLTPHVIPRLNQTGQTFMQDNARPHVARVSMAHLRQNQVNTLPWPACSPDLNPIEHLWDILDRRVRERDPLPESVPQLQRALLEEWNRIPQQQINRLIASMPRRCQAVVRSRGGPTRY